MNHLTAKERSGEQRIVDLIKFLFREYAAAHSLDTDQLRVIKMKEFVEYTIKATDWYRNADIRTALQDTLHLRNEDFEAVWTCFADPWTATALLHPIWHMLALSGQPPVKNIPEFLHVSLTIAWCPYSPEEKALQIQIPTRWNATTPLTNGFLCSLLKDQFDGILQTISGNGLDALYAKHAVATHKPGTPPQPPGDSA